MRSKARPHRFLRTVLVSLGIVTLLVTADESADKATMQRQSLARFQGLVGEWKGVGQPRRGSNRGAWSEEGAWAWKYTPDSAALVFTAKEGKYVSRGTLTSDGKNAIQFAVDRSGEMPVEYAGSVGDDQALIFTNEKPPENFPARISIRTVADGDRMLILYESKLAPSGIYNRLAELGMTRKGSDFGKGTSYTECVVTGGLGTIQVSHEGKNYYVCCTGCRDLFNEDPAAVLLDYRERKEAEKQKTKGGK